MSVCSLPADAQTLGTLFTSPQEREYLDYLREDFLANSQDKNFNIKEDIIPDIPVEEAVEEEAPEVLEYTLGGIMSLGSGRQSIRLNGNSVPEDRLPANMRLIQSNTGTALLIRHEGVDFILKPGQTVNINEQSITESYRITRQQDASPAAPAPEVAAETTVTESEAEMSPSSEEVAASSLEQTLEDMQRADTVETFQALLESINPEQLNPDQLRIVRDQFERFGYDSENL